MLDGPFLFPLVPVPLGFRSGICTGLDSVRLLNLGLGFPVLPGGVGVWRLFPILLTQGPKDVSQCWFPVCNLALEMKAFEGNKKCE